MKKHSRMFLNIDSILMLLPTNIFLVKMVSKIPGVIVPTVRIWEISLAHIDELILKPIINSNKPVKISTNEKTILGRNFFIISSKNAKHQNDFYIHQKLLVVTQEYGKKKLVSHHH